MENLRTCVQALDATQADKSTKKKVFMDLPTSDENWIDARTAFRTADDAFEDAGTRLIETIQQLRSADELESALEELDENESKLLRSFLDERGFSELLSVKPQGLAEMISKYLKASKVWTTAQDLNRQRSALEVFEFEELIAGAAYSDRVKAGWHEVVEALNKLYDELAAANEEADDEAIWREAAYTVERRTREKYDAVTETLVNFMRDLIESGRFDYEVLDLPAELRSHARDLSRMVPAVQVQVETRPAPRPVTTPEAEAQEWAQVVARYGGGN